MSSKILGNVWDACAAHDIKGAKLVIMARLADYSNDDGVCYRRSVMLAKARERSAPVVVAAVKAKCWTAKRPKNVAHRFSKPVNVALVMASLQSPRRRYTVPF